GSDAANGFPPDAAGPRRKSARRMGDGSGLHGGPGTDAANGFPPDAEGPHHNSRRMGEASGPHGVPGDEAGFGPEAARRNGGRRGGGAPGPHGGDAANGFPPDGDGPRRNGNRRIGETSAPRPVPGAEGFPTEVESSRRVGEASTHHPVPGTEVPNGRRGRGGFPQEADDPRRGGRRAGEGSGPRPGFAADPDAPRPSPRRVGEASAHFGAPGGNRRPAGFPDEGFGEAGPQTGPQTGAQTGPQDRPVRPEGVARRRAARAVAAPRPEVGSHPDRFPVDAPPQPGQGSGLFPVDEFHRQGPQADELAEPAIDAPAPAPKPRRSTGVPPVPPPPPPMGDDDLVTMTTEMEAIGGNEELQKRRTIDHTLARFSAVHDEIKAEEREKKAKRRKLRPWERDDEMDRLDELEAQQSMALAIPNLEPKEEDEQQEKKKRRWRKGKNAGKAFAIFFAGMVFLSTAVGWGFKTYIENSAQQVDALDPDSAAIKDAAAQLGDENFLLVGSDTRAGATAEDGVGTEESVVGARSDTVMIAHVPKNRERVVVVSFPRDLEVTRPACEGWDPKTGNYTGQQHPEEKRAKLNTAYMVGGPKCVTKLVQNISGININHFVGIDFHGFKDMVDAVQGVEVCVERPMKDKELGVVVPEAGKNVKLTGDQALNFVRARKVAGDPTADYGRIIRQQRFLSSLLRKAMSSEVLLNPGKLTNFVKAFSKATFGDNIGVDQLFTLGQSMQGVEAGRVTFITLPTTGYENERHNEDMRVEDANALFEAIRQDVALPGEAPKKDDAPKKDQKQTQTQVQSGLMQQKQQQQPTGGTVDPNSVKIQVLNGGNETGGIARDTADDLADLGFQIIQNGAGPATDKTVIRYSKGHEAQAQTLKAAVPGATLVEDPSVASAIILVLGPEFDGKVQSPTKGGAPADVPDNLSTVNAGDVSCA
ncbi:LCP family protein, partial [Actinophytocola sp.]|uniref:LCP family protein n=1 Tax=Actinophytocola sp. TaxID=1872138 RepID=UPI00389A025C